MDILRRESVNTKTINESIRLYFKKGQINYDEFDNILLQLLMNGL